MTANLRRNSLRIAVVVFFVSLPGCDRQRPDYECLHLATVSGQITLDGAPLPDAQVVFESPDGTFSSGVTNGDGRYQLMFNSEVAGVTQGRKTVRISTNAGQFDEEADGDPQHPDQVPARYHRQSELSRAVTEGSQTFDFQLQSRLP